MTINNKPTPNVAEKTQYLSRVHYDAKTGEHQFAVTFQYNDLETVRVLRDAVELEYLTDYFYPSTHVVQLNEPLKADARITIRRETPLEERAVDFVNAAELTEADLDASANQVFFAMQEAYDNSLDSLKPEDDGSMSLSGKRLTNVGDPYYEKDAANKRYVDKGFADAIKDNNSVKAHATQEANRSAQSAREAATSAANSKSSSNEAKSQAERAKVQADRAQTISDGVEAEGSTQVLRIQSIGEEQYQRVFTEGNKQHQRVMDTGTAQSHRVTTQGDYQDARVKTEGNTQTARVTTEGDKQFSRVEAQGEADYSRIVSISNYHYGRIEAEGTEQVKAVTLKGTEQVGLVDTAGTDHLAAINAAGEHHLSVINDSGDSWVAAAQAEVNKAKAQAALAGQHKTGAESAHVAATGEADKAAASAGEASTYLSNVQANADKATSMATSAEQYRDRCVTAETNAKASETKAISSAAKAEGHATESEEAIVQTRINVEAATEAARRAEVAAATLTGALVELGYADLSDGTYPNPYTDLNGQVRSCFWKVNVAGTVNGVDYGVGDTLVYSETLKDYYKIDNTESVTSVNGHKGAVTLSAADVGALTQVIADGRYLGKTAKAADSALLEGKSRASVITEARSGLASTSYAYSKGEADGRFLGKVAKAADAALLEGSTKEQVIASARSGLATTGYGYSKAEADGRFMKSFILEDGDGTEVAISQAKEVKFIQGSNININWTDTATGSDDAPFDLTFSVPNASTSVKGAVQLSDSTTSASSTTAATSKALKTVADEVKALRFEAFPVGSCFLSMTAQNPASMLGYGTWRLITGDASLTFGNGTAQSGAVVGNNNPTVPVPAHSHTATHGLTADISGEHNHASSMSYSRVTQIKTDYSGQGVGTGNNPTSGWSSSLGTGGSGTKYSIALNNANVSASGTSSSGGEHTHAISGSVTVNSAGTPNATIDVRGARIAINVWQRTA
ncbi:phage tail fiber domain-containing protein [Vibrio vulnificus]|uniref:phage tail fiber domain-containing protein n=1 Tax=Vibrio vulnificus TaxID=672 RepID=UPI0001F5BE01|nr:phage tail fiber protein [Vibrio vulnificus]ADV88604.1 tail fiber protein [Vibrio vulnificus MO6-24/O]